VDLLSGNATGCYLVTTQAANRFWLDLDHRLVRYVHSPSDSRKRPIIRPGEDIDLVEVIDCRVGRPLVLVVDLDVPGSWLMTGESDPVTRIDVVPKAFLRP
jgi:hypothetical protein